MQNMKNISDGTHLALDSLMNVNSVGSDFQMDTLKVVTCPVCRAVYVPFWRQEGKECSSFTLLEAAFLRVCHFCFGCLRPACPQCWDQEHNICASCSRAAHLPFRSPLSSFEGLIFSPPIFSQTNQAVPLSFTCLRNGRGYTSIPLPPATRSDKALLPSCPSQVKSTNPAVSPAYPAWLQEVMGQRVGEQISEYSEQVDVPPSEPTYQQNASVLPHTNSLELSPTDQPSRQVLEQVAPLESRTVPEEDLPDSADGSEKLTLVEQIENALIFIISLILVSIVLMLVAALSSADMNALLLRIIHIDIRAEITYLLQLI